MNDQVTLDQLSVNTVRTLSMDAIQQANSDHPGTPMALAPVAYCLWQRFLRFDPEDPIWPNRDRFVLSNGHASRLLYSLLHLAGDKAVNAKYEQVGKLSVAVDGKPDVLLLATDSEVSLCVAAYEQLKAEGMKARGEYAFLGVVRAPAELRDQLGIAVASRTYKAYRALLDTDRWLRLENA